MPWYTHFFTGLPQEAWKAAQTDEQTQLELERIVESIELAPFVFSVNENAYGCSCKYIKFAVK